MFLNLNVLDNYEEPTDTGNDPEVTIINHLPPVVTTHGSRGIPLRVSRHVDFTVYGIQPPRNFRDEYVSARSHPEVFRRIDNRIPNPDVDNVVSQWIGEFDKRKIYNQQEVIFRTLLKGNKGRASDRCGCVQEALYRIQVTYKKLFTAKTIQTARQLAKGYAYSQKNDPFSVKNGWLGL